MQSQKGGGLIWIHIKYTCIRNNSVTTIEEGAACYRCVSFGNYSWRINWFKPDIISLYVCKSTAEKRKTISIRFALSIGKEVAIYYAWVKQELLFYPRVSDNYNLFYYVETIFSFTRHWNARTIAISATIYRNNTLFVVKVPISDVLFVRID